MLIPLRRICFYISIALAIVIKPSNLTHASYPSNTA